MKARLKFLCQKIKDEEPLRPSGWDAYQTTVLDEGSDRVVIHQSPRATQRLAHASWTGPGEPDDFEVSVTGSKVVSALGSVLNEPVPLSFIVHRNAGVRGIKASCGRWASKRGRSERVRRVERSDVVQQSIAPFTPELSGRTAVSTRAEISVHPPSHHRDEVDTKPSFNASKPEGTRPRTRWARVRANESQPDDALLPAPDDEEKHRHNLLTAPA